MSNTCSNNTKLCKNNYRKQKKTRLAYFKQSLRILSGLRVTRGHGSGDHFYLQIIFF